MFLHKKSYFSIAAYNTVNISQGSIATDFRYDGIFSNSIITYIQICVLCVDSWIDNDIWCKFYLNYLYRHYWN